MKERVQEMWSDHVSHPKDCDIYYEREEVLGSLGRETTLSYVLR
jgi:hypothetical protein